MNFIYMLTALMAVIAIMVFTMMGLAYVVDGTGLHPVLAAIAATGLFTAGMWAATQVVD